LERGRTTEKSCHDMSTPFSTIVFILEFWRI
jgi:hypothetical protein